MYLFGKRTDQLESEDITRLVQNQVKESKTLDYKRDFNLEEKDKKEFLFDITSMFNTDGGCIIYGIEELKDVKKQNTGTPKDIIGITLDNEDKLFQKIEDIVRSNTEPSICSIELKKITIDEKHVLVIGIPKGIGLPCMVTFNNTNKFYKRKNTGKYSVDVYELNQMFMQNLILKESVEKFRNDRIEKVRNGKVFPNIETKTSFFIHIIPFSFINEEIIDLSILNSTSYFRTEMAPINANGWDSMYNLDGFATFSMSSLSEPNYFRSYNQLFRNGIYEMYSSRFIRITENDRKSIREEDLISIIEYIKKGILIQEKLQIEPPFFLCISLLNILNGKIVLNNDSLSHHSFTTNEILFPPLLVPTYQSDIKELLMPIFDILWQAVGYNKSSII